MTPIEAKAFIKEAFAKVFEIKDNKIVLCNELTSMIKGDEADKDLASRK